MTYGQFIHSRSGLYHAPIHLALGFQHDSHVIKYRLHQTLKSMDAAFEKMGK